MRLANHFHTDKSITNPTANSARNDCHRGRVIRPNNSVMSSDNSQMILNPFGVLSTLNGTPPLVMTILEQFRRQYISKLKRTRAQINAIHRTLSRRELKVIRRSLILPQVNDLKNPDRQTGRRVKKPRCQARCDLCDSRPSAKRLALPPPVRIETQHTNGWRRRFPVLWDCLIRSRSTRRARALRRRDRARSVLPVERSGSPVNTYPGHDPAKRSVMIGSIPPRR